MSNQSITEYLSAHEFFSEFSDDSLKLGTFKQTTDLFHRVSLKTIGGVALGYFMTSQF